MVWVLVGAAVVVALIYWNYRNGNPTFWKAVMEKPDAAMMLFKLDWNRWQVFEEEPAGGYRNVAPQAEWVGPFRLYVPSRHNTVVVFARAEGLEEAEQIMLEQLRHAAA